MSCLRTLRNHSKSIGFWENKISSDLNAVFLPSVEPVALLEREK